MVEVERIKKHLKYKRRYKVHKTYKAHDEKNECRLGDKVRIVETRPLSRWKRWRVAEILTREEVVEVQPKEIT